MLGLPPGTVCCPAQSDQPARRRTERGQASLGVVSRPRSENRSSHNGTGRADREGG